jgi:hypothetical protein
MWHSHHTHLCRHTTHHTHTTHNTYTTHTTHHLWRHGGAGSSHSRPCCDRSRGMARSTCASCLFCSIDPPLGSRRFSNRSSTTSPSSPSFRYASAHAPHTHTRHRTRACCARHAQKALGTLTTQRIHVLVGCRAQSPKQCVGCREALHVILALLKELVDAKDGDSHPAPVVLEFLLHLFDSAKELRVTHHRTRTHAHMTHYTLRSHFCCVAQGPVFGSSAVLVLVTSLLFPQDHLSPELQDAILQGKEEEVRMQTPNKPFSTKYLTFPHIPRLGDTRHTRYARHTRHTRRQSRRAWSVAHPSWRWDCSSACSSVR